MIAQSILTLILLNYLRKTSQLNGLPSKLDRLFIVGTGISVALLILNFTFRPGQLVFAWLSHVLLFFLFYLIFTRKELSKAKSFTYAFLPLIVVNIVEDAVQLIDRTFLKKWDSYFNAAELFAFAWMVAMLVITNKQKKALEKERLKNEEKEKEYKITEKIKVELEVQVKERTAELTRQKEELQQTVIELKSTQALLIQSEKMASLGELTAGIAHEIQNPLNFVNNFSEVTKELLDEMKEELDKGNTDDAKEIADDVKLNLEKINHHGQRAADIVKGMLQHSRSSSGIKELTNINALADEYFRLAYHGLRAKDKSFNATMKTDFDESIGNINIIPQDMGRVILNLITNAFYVVTERNKLEGLRKKEENALQFQSSTYEPTVCVKTKKVNSKVEITVTDNGNGIPQKILDKIFQPFFTTKPTGQGTGLGLSLSYDIVKAHGGELKVETKEGEGTEFIIQLPVV